MCLIGDVISEEPHFNLQLIYYCNKKLQMDYYYFFNLVGKTEMYIPTLKMFIIQFTCCPCKPKC